MLQSIDHVNLVVEDLEGMKSFYTEVLGLKVTKEVTIYGDWVDATVGLKGVEAQVIYLDLPEGPRVELLKYVNPPGDRPDKLGQSNTMGLRHLAFRVEKIDIFVEQLKRKKVPFLSEVMTVPNTQVTYKGGLQKRLVYFHDPEGNILELCCYT
ncbi:VOC domain-containing protein [Planctomycetales bacterium 10988]|nr:VOC domain-containing protein [Planctomycetales bacterium 10988]